MHTERPVYVNRRMYDAQRRAWRRESGSVTVASDLVDVAQLSGILKMSKGAIYRMIERGEFPSGQYRKGTKNAWKRDFIDYWLSLGGGL